MPTRINVPCNGNGGTNSVNKIADTITFGTSGNCTFISFQFNGYAPPNYPPGFSNRQPPSGGGATISYSYDGSQMPANGYSFAYTTTEQAMLGNGTGVIKNN
jgi:hypothetical protein